MKPMYKPIPETTFGSNPGAKYLCRTLNEIGSINILRNTGKRITGTAAQVAELETAYSISAISPKTLANSLRLMREEIRNSITETGFTKTNLVEQLRSNVQIGLIKRGLRLAAVGRKAERVMDAPHNRASNVFSTIGTEDVDGGIKRSDYYFKDSTTDRFFCAGHTWHDCEKIPAEFLSKCVTRLASEEVDSGITELLNERSEARCSRLNKPHVAKEA